MKENANKIKGNPFFIGEKATDARLDFNITRDIDFIQSDLISQTNNFFQTDKTVGLTPQVVQSIINSLNCAGTN
mgnify:CR=1 FL=1